MSIAALPKTSVRFSLNPGLLPLAMAIPVPPVVCVCVLVLWGGRIERSVGPVWGSPGSSHY